MRIDPDVLAAQNSRMTQTPDIGQQYDAIAEWWHAYHQDSDYGVAALTRALGFAGKGGRALDVGCGAGGRLLRRLEASSFHVTGLDASAKMIELARREHPHGQFIQADITVWQTSDKFDFILAWDSLFHLPLDQQAPVLAKLCERMGEGAVLLYSFGDAIGTHTDKWRGQDFHYSSVGVTQNLEILHANGMTLRHLECDQFPEKHVFAIAEKTVLDR